LPTLRLITFLSSVFFLFELSSAHGQKRPLTLDDFFNSVEIRSIQISPDGHEVVIETVRRDWASNRYRSDLWLYRDTGGGSLVQITQSGHDSAPQWSPDGHSEAIENRCCPLPCRPNARFTDGHSLALTTSSRSGRVESPEPHGIYVVDLPDGGVPRLVLHTLGPPGSWAASSDAWSLDSRQILFSYDFGTPEGPFEPLNQSRLYAVSLAGGKSTRWASGFHGDLGGYAVTHYGSVICAARLGTEVKAYLALADKPELIEKTSWAGTYEDFSAARSSPRMAYVFSSLQQPAEVYLADGPDKLDEAHPITAFNKLLRERELPHGKPYRWKADDDVDVEGMLIYPPGQFGTKHLPMLTLMHGGPTSADGNRFEPDWDRWSALAATQGWLVFQPNFRGSVGYGDAFTLGLVPHAGSRAGNDVLQGVDALVRDDIADPERLTVGGYSFGGYLTNWLITQTTRFKAAVTGAGDVEFVVDWGNNDNPFIFAFALGGVPWEAGPNYNAQAPIWQIGKVTTPTHIVTGAEDFNVYVGEAYLLERALATRGIPNSLLIFPGEGHGLDKNPWHGKIKVREELAGC
jgi:dipeptidyl aminopeptidase/acylaminoacyl peptidase